MEAANKLFGHHSPIESSSESSKEMAAGTVLLGRYMLMELIGQGGTSEIYRARDMVAVLGHDDEQSHIAVKIVGCDPNAEVAESHLMLHEALTTRHLAHPNIIKVYDYHREGHVSFVTMELITGESLSACVLRAPGNKLPYRYAMAILRPTVLALEAAHAQGIIHSDIKPSNILLTEHGDVKVIDFATARASLDAHNNKNQFGRNASYYGYTLAYASPETIADKPAMRRDDVFSLACIVYEVLSGKHPYDRKPSNSIEASSFKLKRPREVGFWQWFALKKALSLQGSKRFQSVHRFMQLFTHSRWLWAYLVAAAVILAGGVVGAQFVSQHLTAEQVQFEKNEKIIRQQEDTQALIKSIRQEAPLLRYQQLRILDNTPELLRYGALGALYDETVTSVLNHVENQLNNDGSGAEVPDFPTLIEHIDKVAVYYPDSVKLSEAKKIVQSEYKQLVSSLTVQARQLWAQIEVKIDFSPAAATTLNDLNAALKKLDTSVVVVPELSVIDVYRKNIIKAIDGLDYRTVNQLFLFSQKLKNGQEFKAQWQLEDARATRAAQLLVDHINQEDRLNKPYPQQAVEYYIQPFFTNINKLLSDAWSDSTIFGVKEQLYKVAGMFQLPDDFPMYKQAHDKLVQKIEEKIVSHKQKRNLISIDTLTKLLEEIRT